MAVATAGTHRIVVGGRALGSSAFGPAAWRLAIEPDEESFEPGPALAAQLAVPLGGTAKLTIPIVRIDHDKLFPGHAAILVSGEDYMGFNRLTLPPTE